MAYAAYTDVEARFGNAVTFTSSTKPTQAQVTQWCVEGDAMLDGALVAAGLTSPNTNTNGLEILKSWNADYAEGKTRRAIAAAGGDDGNTDGQALLDAFYARLDAIADDPAKYGAMLESGNPPDAAVLVRYPSNLDSAGNEIEPIFANDDTVDDLGSQL